MWKSHLTLMLYQDQTWAMDPAGPEETQACDTQMYVDAEVSTAQAVRV